MRAADVMTKGVVAVGPNDAVEAIARTMLEHRVSAVPVLDHDRLIGIVSEGDLIGRLEGAAAPQHWWLSLLVNRSAKYLKAHGRRARDVMTKDAITVAENAPVAEIAQLLEARRIKRVPVMRGGRLVGIVSRSDLLRGLAAGADQSGARPSESDRGIRETILEVIRERTGAGTGAVAVIVVGGVAYLWGVAETQADKDAVRAAAEQIVGTNRVHDFLNTLPGVLRSAL